MSLPSQSAFKKIYGVFSSKQFRSSVEREHFFNSTKLMFVMQTISNIWKFNAFVYVSKSMILNENEKFVEFQKKYRRTTSHEAWVHSIETFKENSILEQEHLDKKMLPTFRLFVLFFCTKIPIGIQKSYKHWSQG